MNDRRERSGYVCAAFGCRAQCGCSGAGSGLAARRRVGEASDSTSHHRGAVQSRAVQRAPRAASNGRRPEARWSAHQSSVMAVSARPAAGRPCSAAPTHG
eukprot:scaffold189472_cov32-Tisochrysis_lutea.AAC.1